MTSNISVDIDAVMQALRRITQHADELPTPGAMRATEGVNVGPTVDFRAALTASAANLGIRVAKIRGLLADSHDQIAQTVKELVASDASLADEAAAIMQIVDSISAPTVATGATVDTGNANRESWQ